MRSEGVLKRKRQHLDLCNTSHLISPFLRWEGPSKQGLARNSPGLVPWACQTFYRLVLRVLVNSLVLI